ncbi:MAG: hypothetical protein LUG95_08830 [Clostridiales bacterium]|nr:hypothetical protein [Clostridiales bacterium]
MGLITGLWHGASSGYLFWGIYHGILIISGALFVEIPIQKLTKALKINTEAWSFKFFQMARTFVLSAIGRIFFVSDGFIEALRIIKRTFSATGLNLHMLLGRQFV